MKVSCVIAQAQCLTNLADKEGAKEGAKACEANI